MDRLPAVRRAIMTSGDLTLQQYLDKLIASVPPVTHGMESFLEVLYRYADEALGPKLANSVCEDIESCPAALTAHHFGVDSLAQSLQSCLMFTRREVRGNAPLTVPVFAFGNVSLNTLTFPAGLLIYELGNATPKAWPQKLRIFPDRLKRTSVYSAPAFDAAMCDRAKARLEALARQELIPDAFCATACDVIDTIYLPVASAADGGFSEQAPRLNHALWNKVYPDVPLVFLQIERLAIDLLDQDLRDESSLIARLLFDEECLSRLIAELEAGDLISTHFFWGIDAKGRNFPLFHNDSRLAGSDLTGRRYYVDFQPDAIMRALREREIMPATFTSFAVISFDRGICGFGGYHQAEYLPRMQRAIERALSTATMPRPVPSDLYLSGMQTVLGGELRHPLGLLEMIHRGGVSEAQLDEAMQSTVTDAHLASITDTLFDVFPKDYDRLAVLRDYHDECLEPRPGAAEGFKDTVNPRQYPICEGSVQR